MALNMFRPTTISPADADDWQGPSFYINYKTQEEVDHYWERLSEGGVKNVCGWLKDRYGIAWNVVPEILGDLMSDEDDEKAGRVMKAMLGMAKLDIAGLRAAYEGREVTQTSR
jgi:predicted 3-demethylubiquinone-9 3-methyltransferase (glyoxalase superfamily)